MKTDFLYKTLMFVAFGALTACSDNAETAPQEAVSVQQVEGVSEQSSHDTNTQSDATSKDTPSSTIRSADSHTHGDAELAIVLENGTITIELDSPLYNILGFEHAPETDAQKTSVSRAEAQLGRGSELFTFNDGADCKIASKDQTVSLFDKEADGHGHDNEHEGHDEHAEEESHKHAAEDSDHHDTAHKDMLLRYEFICANPSSLSNVSVNLFEFFDELSEIDVTYLGASTQKQVTLTRSNSQMDIAQ